MKKEGNKTESRLQQECYVWFWNYYCLPEHSPRGLILHVPNGTREGRKYFSSGLYPGAADLLIVWKGMAYFIELKTETGRQTPAQKAFQAHAIGAGAFYAVVRSIEEFQALVMDEITGMRPVADR